jgi:hypothetical protein
MAISIKGILVGLVFSFVMSLVGGVVMGFVLAAMFGPGAARELMGADTPGTLTTPTFFMDAIVSVATGYVAARVAGRGELINAVLCNLIGGALGLLIVMGMAPDAMMAGIIVLAAEPLFGLLGGYMRLKQAAEYA